VSRTFVALGSINAFLAVALGAFGAHALKPRLSGDLFAVYQTAVQYHGMHALGLVLVGILAQGLPQSPYLRGSGWLMLSGILLFSGSLYALSTSGLRAFGAVTPFGGLAFLIAWLLLAVGVIRGH
jgi:uncharacterized membrane protein YgdD (TMEM256/DUF423 family)